MTSVPKPPRKPKAARRWNSTIGVSASKRSETPTQSLSLLLKKKTAKKKGIRRSLRERNVKSKPIRKVNPVAQAKRRERYRKGLAAYRKSECYKQVEARAGGRCEWTLRVTYAEGRGGDPRLIGEGRCRHTRATSRLTHHHKTYARFGGNELPGDIEVLCDPHNEFEESLHPTRKRNWRKVA